MWLFLLQAVGFSLTGVMATFHGATLLSSRNQRILMGICGAALLFFGGVFILRAAGLIHAAGGG